MFKQLSLSMVTASLLIGFVNSVEARIMPNPAIYGCQTALSQQIRRQFGPNINLEYGSMNVNNLNRNLVQVLGQATLRGTRSSANLNFNCLYNQNNNRVVRVTYSRPRPMR